MRRLMWTTSTNKGCRAWDPALRDATGTTRVNLKGEANMKPILRCDGQCGPGGSHCDGDCDG